MNNRLGGKRIGRCNMELILFNIPTSVNITVCNVVVGHLSNVYPSNVAVHEGELVTLNFRVTKFHLKPPRWFINNKKFGNKIYTGSHLSRPRYYSVNTSQPGQYDLIITSVSMRMAGRYICSMDDYPSREAEVVVLGEFVQYKIMIRLSWGVSLWEPMESEGSGRNRKVRSARFAGRADSVCNASIQGSGYSLSSLYVFFKIIRT